MIGKGNLVEEIRINPTYTQYFLSEFPETGYSSELKEEASPMIVKRTLFTKDYMKKLSTSNQSTILPPNCRYIEETDQGHIVVIEEPPAIRTVKIHKGFEAEVSQLKADGVLEEYGFKGFNTYKEDGYNFTLAFPYVLFILVIERDTRLMEGSVFLRTQQMRGMSDYLFKAPLTNISNNQRVCFGDANKFKTFSLTQTIQNVIMVFWSAVFNTDYTYNYEAYTKAGSEFGNYLRWEYLTKQNPLFIYDANWIKYTYTIGSWLDKIRAEAHVTSTKTMTYKMAAKKIFSPADAHREAPVTGRSKKNLPLFYDIANGMYVGEYFLSIGDAFLNSRQEVLYIDSFVGFSDGGEMKYIMADKSGKKIMMKLTKKVKDYIAFSNKALRYTDKMVLPSNNLEVSSGDILIFKHKNGGEHYGSVDFIRLGRDGRPELKVGKDYYLAENITASKFEMSKPSFFDIPLTKKDEYIIIRDTRGASPLMVGSKVKYEKIRVSGSSSIDFEFSNTAPEIRGTMHHLPLKGSSTVGSRRIARLFRKSEVKSFDGLFRLGKRMYYMESGSKGNFTSTSVAWELPNGLGMAYDSNFSMRHPRDGMVGDLIKNDTFKLPGFLLDLEFSVGDKVIAANWKDPHDILRVKEIAGFSIVQRDSMSRAEDLYFILSDKDGNLTKVKYIYGYSGICNIGLIRKVTNIWNRVSAGTKIIAKESGYSGFPKSTANIIVAFITDTGGDDPLVLCSNGQTLWFSDMMVDFTRVTIRSKKYAYLDHAPMDLSKIKPQAGDLINGTREYKTTEGHLVTYFPKNYRGLRAQYMEYYTGYPETCGLGSRFNREYIYECIPNPRIRASQVEQLGTLSGWPNFHGLFYHSPKSDYHFINEPGRILNVQSGSE